MAELLTADEVRERLRASVAARPSIAAWARDQDLAPQFVSEMISGRKHVSKRVLRVLGLRKVDAYREVDVRAERS